MRAFFLVVVLLVSAQLLFADVRFFTHISYDDFLQLKASYPLKEENLKLVDAYYRITYDEQSRPVEVLYVKDSVPHRDPYWGVTRVLMTYAAIYDQISFLDAQGNRLPNKYGVASMRLYKQDEGRSYQILNYNTVGSLTADEHGVTASLILVNGPQSYNIMYLDAQGQSVKDFRGVGRIDVELSARMKKVIFQSLDRQAQKIPEGYFGTLTYHSDQGLPERIFYIDSKGQTIEDASGVFSRQFSYDEQGRLILDEYRDQDGQLKENTQGVARIQYLYENGPQRVKRTLFYNDRGVLGPNSDGVVVYEEIEDTIKRQREVSSYTMSADLDNFELIEDVEGIAVYLWRYDTYYRPIEQRFFDKNRQARSDKDGVAYYEFLYDARGSLVIQRHHQLDGALVNNTHGIAQYFFQYDDNQRRIRQESFDKQGQRVLDGNGVAIYVYAYDAFSNLLSVYHQGISGQLKDDKQGIASYHYLYDEFGRKIEQKNHNALGELVDDKTGVALYRWVYDEDGLLSRIERYNRQGNSLR